MLKRVFDMTFSLLGLICLGPLLALISVWIKLTSAGPVLYCGQRVGRHGQPFHILKFRSMVVNAESLGASSTARDDPRITAIGALLRRFKLDELPQLWNVLRGEMSFVGPRPQVQWAVDLYTEEERDLLSVRPGITDYASLFFRNEGEILAGSDDPDRDYLKIIAPKKIQLGLYYVRHHKLLVDIQIILATCLAILGVDPQWCLSDLPALEPGESAETASTSRAAATSAR